MTPTRPPWRHRSAGVAVGLAILMTSAAPAVAAPAPCEGVQRYAAGAGADLFRLNRLDLRPAGRNGAPVTGLGVAQTRSALVAESAVNSAAAGRVLGARRAAAAGRTTDRPARPGTGSGDPSALTRVLHEQALPTNTASGRRSTLAGTLGPMSVGAGTLRSRVRWQPAMACGRATGEVARAEVRLDRFDLLGDRTGLALVGVRRGLRSTSTTALERRGTEVHSVARSTVTPGRMSLVGGAVRVAVLRPPTLAAGISAAGGAEIRYVPALVEVSGVGLDTRRLESAGDEVTVALDGDRPSTEVAPAVPGNPLAELLSGLPGAVPAPLSAAPLTLSGAGPLPGVPPLRPSGSGPVATARHGSALRISLGDVRQAMAGHAVAARVTAVHVEIVARSASNHGTLLDLDIGVLEAAAVAPETAESRPATAGVTAGTAGVAAGTAGVAPGTAGVPPETAGRDSRDSGGTGGEGRAADGSLPVSGPRVDSVVAGGVALIAVGFAFLLFGLNRRTFHA